MSFWMYQEPASVGAKTKHCVKPLMGSSSVLEKEHENKLGAMEMPGSDPVKQPPPLPFPLRTNNKLSQHKDDDTTVHARLRVNGRKVNLYSGK